MAGIGAIHGVDDTLKKIAKSAVAPLSPAPTVSVGPLIAPTGTTARINWFLYRIAPNAAYRNMEPPRKGWRTARGRPPLALELHYLLTTFPGSGPGTDGDQEQFSHSAIAAVMQALSQNAILGEGDPVLSPQAAPLVEPLRISLETLDVDVLSKLWTGASQTMRLSVGYQVSLVVVENAADRHAAGPPVKTRRVIGVPSMGPRFVAVSPSRTSAGLDFSAELEGLSSAAEFTLDREPGDPPAPGDWPVTVVRAGPREAVLRVTKPELAPGTRRLDVRTKSAGLPLGQDSIGLTLVPTIGSTAPASAAANAVVTLTTSHAAPDVEVFLRGKPLAAAAVQFVGPTSVKITIPPGTPAGKAPLALRAGKVAGPSFEPFSVT